MKVPSKSKLASIVRKAGVEVEPKYFGKEYPIEVMIQEYENSLCDAIFFPGGHGLTRNEWRLAKGALGVLRRFRASAGRFGGI